MRLCLRSMRFDRSTQCQLWLANIVVSTTLLESNFIAALKMLYDGKNYTIAWSDMTMMMTLQKMSTKRTATMMAYVF